jgi:hypothetical protein
LIRPEPTAKYAGTLFGALDRTATRGIYTFAAGTRKGRTGSEAEWGSGMTRLTVRLAGTVPISAPAGRDFDGRFFQD